MKIVFFGDSITDCGRDRQGVLAKLGSGYVSYVGFNLEGNDPIKYNVVNLGISGDRIVDLYARIHQVWNENPDVLSILIGVNDVLHSIYKTDGVDAERYENVYRMAIRDTKKRFPNIKMVVLEPFFLEGDTENKEAINKVFDYAKAAKKVAKEEGALFLPLQEKLSLLGKKIGNLNVLFDSIHPTVAGSKVIADEWLKMFKENIDCQ